jgi:hypothetical protein
MTLEERRARMDEEAILSVVLASAGLLLVAAWTALVILCPFGSFLLYTLWAWGTK